MTAEALSYLHGANPVPLLGETIGENLDRTVARFPDRDAVISVHQGVRQTYAEFHAAVTEIARGLLALGIEPGDRVGIWSPNNAEWVTLQYATAKVGAILVNVNPAYRTSELAYALAQSAVSTLVLAPRFRQADYLAMLDEVAGQVPTLQRRVVLGPEAPPGALGRPARGGGSRVGRSAARTGGAAAVRRSHQHPVHLRHHRVPQGRHPVAPQHPEQRLLHRRGLPLHRGGPGLHPGALLPLLRHGPR
jgi:fatty-acyl-CoA synthase